MPIGGKIVLKGGQSLSEVNGVKKKKHKGKKRKEKADGEDKSKKTGITVDGKSYEEEFASEIQKAQTGKAKSTPWGSGFAEPPKILHGYSRVVKGDTAEERLDMRCARKTDKFCK